jgi:hypothetical protein
VIFLDDILIYSKSEEEQIKKNMSHTCVKFSASCKNTSSTPSYPSAPFFWTLLSFLVSSSRLLASVPIPRRSRPLSTGLPRVLPLKFALSTVWHPTTASSSRVSRKSLLQSQPSLALCPSSPGPLRLRHPFKL